MKSSVNSAGTAVGEQLRIFSIPNRFSVGKSRAAKVVAQRCSTESSILVVWNSDDVEYPIARVRQVCRDDSP
jgi:hypothetical protein